MSREARVLAQAKINVWLHVGGADDGRFHALSTLFQRIDLADVVTVRVLDTHETSLRVSGPAVPADGLGAPQANLAVRAAEAFRALAGWPRGCVIEIEKNIPVGGGLGGGSADAAAVLRALNALSPKPQPAKALHAAALSIGSDVPFLASGMVRAVAGGRGERLSAFSWMLPPAAMVLVRPSFGISTGEAYRWLDEAGTRDRLPPPPLPQSPPGDWSQLDLGNDFEPVVEARHPFIALARQRLLDNGATVARLSGSGSTVFGIFPGDPPTAHALALDATIIHTRASENVVAVEVRE